MVTQWHRNKSLHLEDSCAFLISSPPTGFLQAGVALFVCRLALGGRASLSWVLVWIRLLHPQITEKLAFLTQEKVRTTFPSKYQNIRILEGRGKQSCNFFPSIVTQTLRVSLGTSERFLELKTKLEIKALCPPAHIHAASINGSCVLNVSKTHLFFVFTAWWSYRTHPLLDSATVSWPGPLPSGPLLPFWRLLLLR